MDANHPLPPLRNPKFRHISRSAAKRESVQLLGSIKDLQLHFSRADVAHRPGAGAGVKGLGTVCEEDGDENRPPGLRRERSDRDRLREKFQDNGRERKPWKEVEMSRIDARQARTEVAGLMEDVREIWGLGERGDMTAMTSDPIPHTSVSSLPAVNGVAISDTRALLTTTARAIRRIRTLALSLNLQSSTPLLGQPSDRRASGTLPRPSKSRQSISTPSRPAQLPRAVSYGTAPQKKSSLGPLSTSDEVDELGELRKAGLEVLAGLRGLEEALRIEAAPSPSPASPSNDQHHMLSLSTDGGRSTPSSASQGDELYEDTTPSISMRPDPSLSRAYDEAGALSDEEDFNVNALAEDDGETRGHLVAWEERIVLEGRQYRSIEGTPVVGGRTSDLYGRKERKSVESWLKIVERLFGGKAEKTGPKWALGDWNARALERVHEFLLAHLSLHLQLLLPVPSSQDSRMAFLTRLSDGYLVAIAFNAAIASSGKAWGFIPEDDIQDTLASSVVGESESATPEKAEVEKIKEWTFKKIGNLTCWAAAIRLRYGIPIQLPNMTASLLSVPAMPPLPRTQDASRKEAERINLDPTIVAKRMKSWAEMLERVLIEWVGRAAREVKEGLDSVTKADVHYA